MVTFSALFLANLAAQLAFGQDSTVEPGRARLSPRIRAVYEEAHARVGRTDGAVLLEEATRVCGAFDYEFGVRMPDWFRFQVSLFLVPKYPEPRFQTWWPGRNPAGKSPRLATGWVLTLPSEDHPSAFSMWADKVGNPPLVACGTEIGDRYWILAMGTTVSEVTLTEWDRVVGKANRQIQLRAFGRPILRLGPGDVDTGCRLVLVQGPRRSLIAIGSFWGSVFVESIDSDELRTLKCESLP